MRTQSWGAAKLGGVVVTGVGLLGTKAIGISSVAGLWYGSWVVLGATGAAAVAASQSQMLWGEGAARRPRLNGIEGPGKAGSYLLAGGRAWRGQGRG